MIIKKGEGDDHTSSANPARSIADLRRALGIRPHENMTTAEVVVVVEGTSEERAFPELLVLVDPELGASVANGRCRVLSAGGAPNIPSVVRALARDATSCTVFVDSDESGNQAAERVRSSGLMLPLDVFRVPNREGCPETEFEDLFDPAVYLDALNEQTNLGITVDDFMDAQRRSGGRGRLHGKWSDVMERLANQRGIEWDTISDLAKTAVADSVVDKAKNGQLEAPEWITGLANRVVHYLNDV